MSDIVRQTSVSNTPIVSGSATAIDANSARIGWSIQNLGTSTLFVKLGASASLSSFHYALKGGSANDDGNGASISQMDGVVYTGIITVAGTPRYIATYFNP